MAQVTKNAATRDYKEFEHRSFSQPIVLRGGVDQETSKFATQPGTLIDALNYAAAPSGYERMRGLRWYDGTYDQQVTNAFVVVAADGGFTSFSGTRFTLGSRCRWGDYFETNDPRGYGTCVYYERVTSPTAYTILMFVDIEGALPAQGDPTGYRINDGETDGELSYLELDYAPCELADAVHPVTGTPLAGTITQYLATINTVNYELAKQTGVDSYGARNTYHGDVPGSYISGGWQFDDAVYVVTDCSSYDFDEGGAATNTPITPGTIVTKDGTTYAVVIDVRLDSGRWEDGTAAGTLLLAPSYVTSYESVDWSTSVLGSGSNLKDKTNTTVLATPAPTVGGFSNKYDNSFGGTVWKATINGWDFVNTGWSMDFQVGTNAPNVPYAPLFQNNVVSPFRSTGTSLATAGANVTSGVFTAWTSPGSITLDDGTYATCNLATTTYSDKLVADFSNTLIPNDDSKIVGIEVTVQARATGAGGRPYDHDVRIKCDSGTSQNKATKTQLPGASAVTNIVYGGDDDLWGFEELTVADINDANFEFEIQFYNPDGSAGQVEVDFVQVEVTYAPNKDTLYFYDGSTDVAYANVIAYQQDGGSFQQGTAYGTMSLDFTPDDQEENIGLIVTGMSIFTEPNGEGELIAQVKNPPKYNLLPSAQEMNTASTFYQSVRANFYENDETEAVYVVNGVGRAFSFSNDGFFFIKTPLPKSADKPRFVAFHDNRLALGFAAGFVALSGLGVPNDFTGVTGADPSLWSTGDRLTGLLSARSNVLIVLSEESIRTLEGSGEESGTMRVISPNSGARQYTAINLIEPVFADNKGITTISASEKFGDFDLGRVTDPLRTWVQDRLQDMPTATNRLNDALLAIPVRNKNQYRLFFKDGYILIVYFAPDGRAESTFAHYETFVPSSGSPAEEPTSTEFVPVWVDSSVLSTGRERIVMATENYVYIVDGSDLTYTSAADEGLSMPCWIVTNPVNAGSAETLGKTFYASLQGKFWGYESVDCWSDTNYDFDKTGAADTTVEVGQLSESPKFYARQAIVRPYLPTLTDGVTFKFKTELNGLPPHTLQSIILRQSSSGINRNRASREY